jgi:putative ABC transport system ATP-binding protein
MDAAAPVLVARDVTKRFGDDHALRGISLSLGAGEVVAVVGPSGCGKSTLLHCLAGVLPVDGGTITYAGKELGRRSPTALADLRRTEFGFVFQSGQLVPELRAVDNVVLPLLLNGVRRPEATARAAELLDRLGVGHLAKRRPGGMSGGQAQRVAIARALVTGPRVVLADEPTGALDSATGAEVMEHLVGLAAEHGVALVVVTHDREVAARAHRRIHLRDGRIEAYS